ncbi:MAG: hypothetical protein ACYDAE_22515, partial [Steroidobacteraceae bacterium]
MTGNHRATSWAAKALVGTLASAALAGCGGGSVGSGAAQGSPPLSKAVPAVTWPTPAAAPVGTVLGSAQLDATADVSGTFAYSPAAGTVESSAGSVTLSVVFTPTDTTDYTTATDTVTLQIGTANYTWQHVQIVGGGYIDGVYFHPTQQGLLYARTDIGGAYRWSQTDSEWVPLLDWVSPADWWYEG